LGFDQGQAGALINVGRLEEADRAPSAALESYRRAIALYRRLGKHEKDVVATLKKIERVENSLREPADSTPAPRASP